MQNMNKILDESDRIKKLDDLVIKEIYIKKELWKSMRKRLTKKYAPGINPLETKEFGDLVTSLKQPGITRFIQEKMSDDYKDLSVNEMFDEYTGSVPEKVAVEIAREKINGTISGGCGMPIHEIIRDLISTYEDMHLD